jgi:YD repeat-containing protein
VEDAAGRRTSVTLPNGVVIEYTYDAASRVTGLAYRKNTTTLGTLSYTYDAAGNRLGVGGTWARTALPPALRSRRRESYENLWKSVVARQFI